jgi:hypothetical protein
MSQGRVAELHEHRWMQVLCRSAAGRHLLMPTTLRGYGCRVSCLTNGLWTNWVCCGCCLSWRLVQRSGAGQHQRKPSKGAFNQPRSGRSTFDLPACRDVAKKSIHLSLMNQGQSGYVPRASMDGAIVPFRRRPSPWSMPTALTLWLPFRQTGKRTGPIGGDCPSSPPGGQTLKKSRNSSAKCWVSPLPT